MNLEKIKNDPRLPKHVAFIMDGNGRWALKRGLSRLAGHVAGRKNMKDLLLFAKDLGIKNLSLYCFSAENWKRPQEEVDALMKHFDELIDEFNAEYLNYNIRVVMSGDLTDTRIPEKTRIKAQKIIRDTENKTGYIVNICVNYGGRQELLKAINELTGKTNVSDQEFESHLYSKDLLPLDFVIRTSGEMRTSNFMPWQSVYSEWYFTKKPWPCFSRKDFVKSLKNYMNRNRRFGGLRNN